MDLDISLSPNRQRLSIRAADGQELPGELTFEASELDDLVKGLATMRAAMTPPIPQTLEPTSRYYATKAWGLRPEPAGALAFGMHHPGLGWILNLLPKLDFPHFWVRHG